MLLADGATADVVVVRGAFGRSLATPSLLARKPREHTHAISWINARSRELAYNI